MKREFSPETRELVLGNVLTDGMVLRRTPLHVEFTSRSNLGSAKMLDAADVNDPDLFNAVGSLCHAPTRSGVWHLPVIDADGGATVCNTSNGSEATLLPCRDGTFEPTSDLDDVLNRNDISLEVSSWLKFGKQVGGAALECMKVKAIILRSRMPNVFEAMESTREGHSHLYIQRAFSPDDHKTLIYELGKVGIISRTWQRLTVKEELGVVRTPWTKKAANHRHSD